MSYRLDPQQDGQTDIVIDGWENGIAASPYKGIANIRNLNTSYYPSVAYVNYARKACTLTDTIATQWYAGTHSINVSDNTGWVFTAQPSGPTMTNPVQQAQSPVGLNYILDDSGQIWKQFAVNSSTFNLLGDVGRYGNGAGGLAYWNNYLVVFGDGLVEFCGDGSGDAGITNSNWNINTSNTQTNSFSILTNFAVNPWRILQLNGFQQQVYPLFQNGDPVTFTTTGTLPSPLVAGTTYYLALPLGGNNYNFAVSPRQQDTIAYLANTYTAGTTYIELATNWTGITGNYVIIFSTGEYRTVTLVNGTQNYTVSALSSNETVNIQIVIPLTSNGSGTNTITDIVKTVPLGNATSVNLFPVGVNLFPVGLGPYTSFTFDDGNGFYGSYIDPTGTTVTGMWKGASGNYSLIMANGQEVAVNLTNNSPVVSLINGPLDFIGLGSNTIPGYGTAWILKFIDNFTTDYRTYVSPADGNLYFCNNRNIGRLFYNPDVNLNFSPAIAASYIAKYDIVAATIPNDVTHDMVDLNGQLVFSGNFYTYVWDYISVQPNASRPLLEKIYRLTNILNNIYILAGTKGNIYVSNGYSAQLLFKIPDYLSGVIDPIILWGGSMFHRAKLWFQALIQKTDGTNVLAGIFSLTISPTMLGESAQGLVMESQNSYGLIPSSGATGAGVLIDNEAYSTGVDSYYSAWSNGSSLGGIDYNDTTLWGSNEPIIETDIIPIGTILNKASLGNIEFKLDRPMVTGDSISLYWRPSLSDSYTLIGTTTLTQLSDYKPTSISQSQWAQFKVTFSCASSGSSFIPLREIRIHLT